MKVIIVLLSFVLGLAFSQHVNNVHLMGHTAYVISIFQEMVTELEQRGWSNLKVPVITNLVNETVLDRHFEGTVTYSNGFLASMQRIDMLERGIDQIWSWNNTDSTGTVRLTGTLRMLDVALGYDVVADLQDSRHRYTVTATYPETQFVFNIHVNVHTFDVSVSVTPRIVSSATIRTIKFLPLDETSDVLTTMFNLRLPEAGFLNWGEEVFTPIIYDVYHNRVEFPKICYDCPLASTFP